MPNTLEEIKTVLSQEKIDRIGFYEIIENFSEGKNLQEMLGISDELMQKLYESALSYLNSGQYDEASDCFLFLAALNPLESNLWLKAGNADHALRRFSDALDSYSFAILCDADDPFPHYYSAQIFYALEEYEQAQESVEICLELIDEHPDFSPLREHVDNLKKKVQQKLRGANS